MIHHFVSISLSGLSLVCVGAPLNGLDELLKSKAGFERREWVKIGDLSGKCWKEPGKKSPNPGIPTKLSSSPLKSILYFILFIPSICQARRETQAFAFFLSLPSARLQRFKIKLHLIYIAFFFSLRSFSPNYFSLLSLSPNFFWWGSFLSPQGHFSL